jgi:SAM-dependent methyltransferase
MTASQPSTIPSRTDSERLEALEKESADRLAEAHRALAVAQDRNYWLDRWNVDLNALMQRRGAAEARALLRRVRFVYRVAKEIRERAPLAQGGLAEEASQGEAAGEDSLRRALSPDRLLASPVTDLLYARLTESDVQEVAGSMGVAESALWETADERDRRRLTLAFAAYRGLEGALERTGLTAAMPDPGVHTMAHGPAAAGGSTYYADLVTDALARSGAPFAPGMTALDFGCSSGRVVRVLRAAFPDVDWHGCDPIPDAIEWASANLPGISFVRSPEYPPLPYADAAFDAVFAISIWSHFSADAGGEWLREMRRIVKPGGRLLLSTHGEQTLWHDHRAGLRPLEQLESIRRALYEDGFWFANEFGESGDHGIANPDWGSAFLTPEWLASRLTPEWQVALYRPGRVEDNQDLYVLERR